MGSQKVKQLIRVAAVSILLAAAAGASAAMPPPAPVSLTPPPVKPEVKFITTEGSFVVRLDPQRAPLTVKNFLQYVRSGFYNGTIFQRVIPGFVIQGGGFTVNYKEKKTRKPIPNESGNGLSNVRGTIAMARETAPDTAAAQFYINLANNTALDPHPSHWGYAVFGRVVSGMKTINRIASVPTGPAGPFKKDAPQIPVVIQKVFLLKNTSDS